MRPWWVCPPFPCVSIPWPPRGWQNCLTGELFSGLIDNDAWWTATCWLALSSVVPDLGIEAPPKSFVETFCVVEESKCFSSARTFVITLDPWVLVGMKIQLDIRARSIGYRYFLLRILLACEMNFLRCEKLYSLGFILDWPCRVDIFCALAAKCDQWFHLSVKTLISFDEVSRVFMWNL